eukprot:UN07268
MVGELKKIVSTCLFKVCNNVNIYSSISAKLYSKSKRYHINAVIVDDRTILIYHK